MALAIVRSSDVTGVGYFMLYFNFQHVDRSEHSYSHLRHSVLATAAGVVRDRRGHLVARKRLADSSALQSFTCECV